VGDIVEEVFPFCGVVTELVAEDAERPWGIAESTSDGLRREALDEEASESFVVFVQGFLWVEEEARLGVSYCISGTDTHGVSMLFIFTYVKWAVVFNKMTQFKLIIKGFRERARQIGIRISEPDRLILYLV